MEGKHFIQEGTSMRRFSTSSKTYFVSHLECSKCRKVYDHNILQNLCGDQECASPLLVRYELDAIKKSLQKNDLRNRKSGMWRYRELLPVKGDPITMQELETPITQLKKVGQILGFEHLYMKNEAV